MVSSVLPRPALSRAFGVFAARLTDGELAACASVMSADRSLLGSLPAGAPADAGVWTDLIAKQVADRERRLVPLWEDALGAMARATVRVRLRFGTPSGFEQASFFSSTPLREDSLVSHMKIENVHRITFPASPQDVAAFVDAHLLVGPVHPASGFAESLDAAGYAALLAIASGGTDLSRPLDAPGLVAAWNGAASPRKADVPAVPTWISAPWPLGLDNRSAAAGLHTLRQRALVYSWDGDVYLPAPALAPLAGDLARMQRYAAVECCVQSGAADVLTVSFLIVYGRERLWLFDFNEQARAVFVRSISTEDIHRVFDRVVDLTWTASRRDGTTRGAKEATVAATARASVGQTRQYELNEEELAALVRAGGWTPPPGSPLARLHPRGGRVEAEAVPALVGRDMLTADVPPKPTRHMAFAIRALAEPDLEIAEIGGLLPELSVSRQLVAVDAGARFVVAYGSDGPDRHRIQFPVLPDELFPITQSVLALGLTNGVAPFEASWDVEEYLTIVALADLFRAATLDAMRTRTSPSTLMVSASQLARVSREGWNGGDRRWLVTVVRDLGAPAPLADGAIPNALDRLARKGFLVRQSGTGGEAVYEPSPECAALCQSLARTAAAVGVGIVAGRRAGTPQTLAFHAFWAAGLLWLAEYSGGSGRTTVRFRSVLPAELNFGLQIAYREACSTSGTRCTNPACGRPTTIGEAFCKECGTPIPAVSPSGRPCPNPRCSATVGASDQFCVECGTVLSGPPAVVPAAARCANPSCGALLAAGNPFCSECGTAVPTGARVKVATERRCPVCRHLLRPDERFCPNDGTEVS